MIKDLNIKNENFYLLEYKLYMIIYSDIIKIKSTQ
jgi:hypothetical protein